MSRDCSKATTLNRGDEVLISGVNKWLVLEVDKENRLAKLIMMMPIEKMRYSSKNTHSYPQSEIREKLNNKFYKNLNSQISEGWVYLNSSLNKSLKFELVKFKTQLTSNLECIDSWCCDDFVGLPTHDLLLANKKLLKMRTAYFDKPNIWLADSYVYNGKHKYDKTHILSYVENYGAARVGKSNLCGSAFSVVELDEEATAHAHPVIVLKY